MAPHDSFLTFYEGGDPEIDAGCLSMIQKQMEKEPESFLDASTIQALAYLQLDEAADILIGLLEEAPPERLQGIVTALWYQRNPRALPALRSFRSSVSDEFLGAVIDGAVLSLEAGR